MEMLMRRRTPSTNFHSLFQGCIDTRYFCQNATNFYHYVTHLFFLLKTIVEEESEYRKIGKPAQLDVQTDAGNLRLLMKVKNGAELEKSVGRRVLK